VSGRAEKIRDRGGRPSPPHPPGRAGLRFLVSLSALLALASARPGPAEGPPSSATMIRWEVDPAGRTTSVSLVGLAPEALRQLRSAGRPDGDRAMPLAVEVDAEGQARADGPRRGDRPAMLGTYRVVGETLRFTPRYPLDRGRRYRATFRPAGLPGANGPGFTATHLVPKPPRAATVVTRVDPSGDRLPENLLKFYLHFSAPMGRGEAYDHLRLLAADGRPVVRPFLELGEELWDPTGTRLTVLLDPGRIKRGLKPREEFGPILEAGRTYTLAVDPAWRDAEGDPLGAPARKTFRAEAADEAQPDPRTWTIARPAATTRNPLAVAFPEPLDRALLESGLTLVDARGEAVPGRAEVEPGQARWRFTPDRPWAAGDYDIQVDADLEDLAGNSVRRPFEVDIQRDTPTRPEATTVRLPVAIQAAGP